MYLILLALAPAIYLLNYVRKKDRSEKEPPKLLALLFFAGALSCIPAAIIESNLGALLTAATGIDDTASFSSHGYSFVIYQLINNFLIVGLAEEGVKFLAMFLITHKNRNFNSLFDGMIYAIFVSLGFAAFENILYVAEGGAAVALMRAVMSVPGHMFFAVFMGYYYSIWHIYKTADRVENSLAMRRIIQKRGEPFRYKGYLISALIVPILIHGFYDFCLSFDSTALFLAVLALLISLYIICFKRIKKFSRADMEDYKIVPILIMMKYTELAGIAPTGDAPLTHTQLIDIAEKRNKAEQALAHTAFTGPQNKNPYSNH